MSNLNLFWPVYKNLEKEFLQLADYIHFTDDQTKVYSMHIADLIVRCSIEIEAISKELYLKLGGNLCPDANKTKRDLYFDTDCLDLLEKHWNLSKKQVMVSAPTFYFINEANRILAPLHKANKRGTSGSKWKQAYQAVKHNRKSSLKKASIQNLLYAMGALYILNLYYRNETFHMGRVYTKINEFDNRVGSDIFSIFIYDATSISLSLSMNDSCIEKRKDNNLDKSIYIIKHDDKSFKQMYDNFRKDTEVTLNNFTNSSEIIKFLKNNPNYKMKNINKTCMDAGGINLLTKIVCFSHTTNNNYTEKEAVINKHSGIYPTLSSFKNEHL